MSRADSVVIKHQVAWNNREHGSHTGGQGNWQQLFVITELPKLVRLPCGQLLRVTYGSVWAAVVIG